MKAIIFTNADWHFYNHLLPIAKEAKKQNFDVKILTNVDKHKTLIEKEGLSVIPLKINRSSINPFRELVLLYKIILILYSEKPSVLFNFTLKPIIYGSIASILCRIPKINNTFLGMGYLFISNNILPKLIRYFLSRTISLISRFKNMKFIVQNSDDKKLLSNLRVADQSCIITQCCVGINIKEFSILKYPKGKVSFVLLSRMLIDKGVREFVEAARILKSQNIDADFLLVGSPDDQNKSSISLKELEEYHEKGYVKYLGYRNNIKEIWAQNHVAVLPSYREGLSRSLIEAGAYQRAIITTDAPGGRDLVQNNLNGMLVPIKDAKKLAHAMKILATDVNFRKKIATNMRDHVVKNYESEFLAKKFLQKTL